MKLNFYEQKGFWALSSSAQEPQPSLRRARPRRAAAPGQSLPVPGGGEGEKKYLLRPRSSPGTQGWELLQEGTAQPCPVSPQPLPSHPGEVFPPWSSSSPAGREPKGPSPGAETRLSVTLVSSLAWKSPSPASPTGRSWPLPPLAGRWGAAPSPPPPWLTLVLHPTLPPPDTREVPVPKLTPKPTGGDAGAVFCTVPCPAPPGRSSRGAGSPKYPRASQPCPGRAPSAPLQSAHGRWGSSVHTRASCWATPEGPRVSPKGRWWQRGCHPMSRHTDLLPPGMSPARGSRSPQLCHVPNP